MKKILCIFGIVVFAYSFISCRSWGNNSELEGVVPASYRDRPTAITEFLPADCQEKNPSKAIVENIQMFTPYMHMHPNHELKNTTSTEFWYYVLPETCTNPADTSKIRPTDSYRDIQLEENSTTRNAYSLKTKLEEHGKNVLQALAPAIYNDGRKCVIRSVGSDKKYTYKLDDSCFYLHEKSGPGLSDKEFRSKGVLADYLPWSSKFDSIFSKYKGRWIVWNFEISQFPTTYENEAQAERIWRHPTSFEEFRRTFQEGADRLNLKVYSEDNGVKFYFIKVNDSKFASQVYELTYLFK